MNRTKIEWVKNPDGTQGYTWNPITGCLNGCEYCYARKLANGRLRTRYLANWNFGMEWQEYSKIPEDVKAKAQTDPFYPRFWPERLDEDLGICRGIFPCDMSDLFGIGVPDEWTRQVLDRIKRSSHRNRYYLLTKQPQNLPQFSPFPDNCWVGVSATDIMMFHNACYYLASIKASIKYLSLEPFLEWEDDGYQESRMVAAGIKQVIIGTQTKPYKPPKIEWVQEIVQACDKAEIPVFLKENLKPLFKTAMPHDDEIYLRQEMPK